MEKELKRSKNEQIPLEIIYISANSSYTKRRIYVKEYDKITVHAYCCKRNTYRTFRRENILAVQLLIS